MRETVDAERLTRASLAKLPDGEWSFEDWIDDDGVDYGKPIRLFVTIRRPATWCRLTGTSPQVRAPSTIRSASQGGSYTGIRSVLPPGIPNNEGVFRAIE
jgi:N-methylhydantoinase B